MKKLILLSLLCITTTIVSDPNFINDMKRAVFQHITKGDNSAQVRAFQTQALEACTKGGFIDADLERVKEFIEGLLPVLPQDQHQRAEELAKELRNTISVIRSKWDSYYAANYAPTTRSGGNKGPWVD